MQQYTDDWRMDSPRYQRMTEDCQVCGKRADVESEDRREYDKRGRLTVYVSHYCADCYEAREASHA